MHQNAKALRGRVWQGMANGYAKAGRGGATLGTARFGLARLMGLVGFAVVGCWFYAAGCAKARLMGLARLGLVRYCVARHSQERSG